MHAVWIYIACINALSIPWLFEVPDTNLVSSKALQNLISKEALFEGADQLAAFANKSIPQYGHPTRVIASAGHNATIDYIQQTLHQLGGYYDVVVQPFMAVYGRIHNSTVRYSNGTVIKAVPMTLTPKTNGTVRANVSFAGDGCTPSDYKGLQGVALVRRGGCSFATKAEVAGSAGAQALLVYDSKQEMPWSGSLRVPLPNQVATLSVDRALAEDLRNGAVEVDICVDSDIYEIPTQNIIAETTGGDHDNVVMLGSHSDSVAAGPGLNDNGSGLLSLLEVAKQLSKFRVKNAVRFAWWAAEEEGLLGSLHYTRSLLKHEAMRVRLFLDYDMMASQNYVYEIYDSDDKRNPKGSSALRDMYIEWYKENGLNYTLQPFDGRSDYVGFLDLGIPSSGVDTGAEPLKTPEQKRQFGGKVGEQLDPCYHMACDTIDNLNEEAWMVQSRLIAHSAAVYARSLAGFPGRVMGEGGLEGGLFNYE